jgi:hypothetical protein
MVENFLLFALVVIIDKFRDLKEIKSKYFTIKFK